MYSLRAIAASLTFAAAVSATNILTFQSLDSVARTGVITANAGIASMAPFSIPAGGSVDVEFASGFVGNVYTYTNGSTNTPGMLAEVNFQGWNGLTYFDVSAIVNPADVNNVKEMYPAATPNTPVSGCSSFPCDNAYYLPDDVQTKTTSQTHIIVTVGANNAAASKRSADEKFTNVARNLVEKDY